MYIQKYSDNKMLMTLTETSRLTNPYYLFEFIPLFNPTLNNIYYTTPDESLNTCRYNLFNLTDSVSGSTNGGISVPLDLAAGKYRCNVYESTGQTLSVSATTGTIINVENMDVVISTDIFNSNNEDNFYE